MKRKQNTSLFALLFQLTWELNQGEYFPKIKANTKEKKTYNYERLIALMNTATKINKTLRCKTHQCSKTNTYSMTT